MCSSFTVRHWGAVLGVVLIVVLTGCSGSGESVTPEGTSDVDAPPEVDVEDPERAPAEVEEAKEPSTADRNAPARPVASAAQPPDADAYAEVGVSAPVAARRVFALTNEVRRARSRAPLERDSTLDRIACWHNQDMLANEYMGHEDADERLPSHRTAREHRRLIGSVGENVYESSDVPPSADDWAQRAVEGWMESPGHRANLLRRSFTHLGTCVTHNGSVAKATQVFSSVWGYPDRPLPWSVAAGDSLTVSVTPFRAAGPPAEYAFVPVGEPLGQAFEGAERGRPFDGTLQFPATPGEYGTRFLFPVVGKGRYSVLSGPRVQVE